MEQYVNLLNKVWNTGEQRYGRNGKTVALFGETLTFDLNDGFPAVTVKKLAFKSAAAELAGFLRAETDASKMGSSIWLANAKHWSGTTYMGKIYGRLWRKWEMPTIADNHRVQDGQDLLYIDQLALVVKQLKHDPYSRRHVVTAWDPARLQEGCLPPCHYAFQFFVGSGRKLSCMVHMRSVDCILGLPFDIASYALLTHIVAQEVCRNVGKLVMTFGDTHIYAGHEDAYYTLTKRTPLPLPKLMLNTDASIDNFTADMASLLNYQHHDAVQAELFV